MGVVAVLVLVLVLALVLVLMLVLVFVLLLLLLVLVVVVMVAAVLAPPAVFGRQGGHRLLGERGHRRGGHGQQGLLDRRRLFT